MNAERLLKHYERIANAPDAVARLRRFILDLAVRGKLESQRPQDEPASELLKQIVAEKARLVESGDLRKPRDLDKGAELDEPFVIPKTWRWVRLDNVGAIVGGGTPSANDADNFAEPGEGIPWLTPADLGGYSDLYISRGARDLSEKGLRTSSATVMPKGTVLFTSRAPIGYVAIATIAISTNQGFKSIVPYVAGCSRFIATAMKAFAPEIDAKAPGTTFKEVSGKIVAAIPFPLPPLAEQKRIVAKVDELMALCDQLEKARGEREATRDRLTTATFARLNDPTPETFQADVRFALDALPALTMRADQVKQLRKTILNLAVRGKLVPQDANEKPSWSPHKQDVIDIEGRLNVDIPLTWRWVRVEDVAEARLGKMLDKAKNKGRPYQYLRNTNVHWFDIRLDDLKTIPLEKTEFEEYRLKKRDVLICEGGHGIGRTAVWNGAHRSLVFQKALHRVRPGPHLNPQYFAECCFVYFDAGIMQTYFTGVGIPHFTGRALAKLVLPLPPLAEQHRIVAKVDELMSVCDRLEASLTAGEDSRSRLLDALLHEALKPASGALEAAA